MDTKNRRDFLKSLGALSLSAWATSPYKLISNTGQVPERNIASNKKKTVVSILQTTDVHCQINPHDELFWENEQSVFRKTGGYAYIAAMLKKLKAENPNTFTIDTGDMFQGSQLSTKTTGKALVPVLNSLKYDVYLPGNWEVIYGKKNMQALLGSLNAPTICANMYHDSGEGKRGELIFPPYHIWRVAGVKIGFLGYTDPLVPIRQSPSYSKGIVYTKPEENISYYIDILKNREQCAFLIVMAHLGLSQQIALANMPESEGINYILGGDTHERVRQPIQCKYAKVVEPGAFGSFIGKLDLTLENGKVVADSYELLEVNTATLAPDQTVQKILTESELPYQKEINEIVGYSTIPLYRYFVVENPIDTMVLNALHWKFPEIDICLSNGFRFCQPNATRDHTGNIPITHGYVFDMLPVDTTLRTGKASGKQLKEWLEKELNNVFAKDASKRLGGWVVKFKGMQVSFNAFADMGKRVQTITIGGKEVDDQQRYSILACQREGDPEDMVCRLKGISDARNITFTLHNTILSYLKANSPVTPTPPLNAVILDAPQTLLSQVSGVAYQFK